jgi:twitching motility protein PilT
MPQEFAFPSIDAYLVKMLELGASDLFLRPGTPPTYRVNGKITRTDFPTPSEKDMRTSLDKILTSVAKQKFDESPDIDIAYTMPGKGRFRINLFMHQGQLGLAARAIPIGNVEFKTLSLPAGVLEMVNTQAGLILVVGPTGCGKSTTLAALVHHINANRDVHIVTIEDPIEFVHDEIRSLIHQRQVGYDTESFARALRHIVRQSPDVILIGEMRDSDTMQTALSAALTGHLILSTLHTTNAVQSIDRILNYFPGEARAQAQVDLAITLIGIVSMRLLRKADGSGRIPAVEILLATPTIRRLIKEGEFVELYDVIKRSQDYGMCSFNQSLIELVQSGQVTEKEALPYAPNPEEFMLNIQGMYTGIDSIDLRAKKKKEEEEK